MSATEELAEMDRKVRAGEIPMSEPFARRYERLQREAANECPHLCPSALGCWRVCGDPIVANGKCADHQPPY